MSNGDDKWSLDDFETIAEPQTELQQSEPPLNCSNCTYHNCSRQDCTTLTTSDTSTSMSLSPAEELDNTASLQLRRSEQRHTQQMDLKVIHEKRERQWMDEKEGLLEEIMALKKKLEEQFEQRDATKEKLQTQFESGAQAYQDLQYAYDTMKNKCNEMKESMNKLANEKETNEDSSMREINRLNQIVQESTRQINTLSAEQDTWKREYNAIKETNVAQCSEITRENEQLKEAFLEKTNQVASFENEAKKKEELEGIVNLFEKELKECKAILTATKTQCKTLQQEKDELDDKLINIQLDHTRSEKESQQTEKQNATEVSRLTEELKRLKQENQKTNKAMDALNIESSVLRDRMQAFEFQNSALESAKARLENEKDELSKRYAAGARRTEKELREQVSKLEKKNRDLETQIAERKKTNKNRPAPQPASPTRLLPASFSKPPPSRPQPNSQSQMPRSPASARATTSLPTLPEQWYESDEGQELLQEIYNQLKQPLSGNVELSRSVSDKNLSMIVTADGNHVAKILFPRDFPGSSLVIETYARKRMLEFPYNRNISVAEFANKVVTKLLAIMFD